MTDRHIPPTTSLTDDQREQIREICGSWDISLRTVELQSGVLILSPDPESTHPNVEEAQQLADELKDLGFDFVTITAPITANTDASTDTQPDDNLADDNAEIGNEPTDPITR